MVRLSRNAQLFVRTVMYRDAKGMIRVVFAPGRWKTETGIGRQLLAGARRPGEGSTDSLPERARGRYNHDETEWSAGAYLESGWSAVRKGARP